MFHGSRSSSSNGEQRPKTSLNRQQFTFPRVEKLSKSEAKLSRATVSVVGSMNKHTANKTFDKQDL